MDADCRGELRARLVADYDELHRRLGEAVANLSTEDLDRAPAPGTNSITVLVTHLLASELDWLGTAAGHSVSRDRDREFAARNGDSATLAEQIESTRRRASLLIDQALEARLDTARSHVRTGRAVTVGYCLLHSLAHTAEHVGHVELTRQLVTGGS